MPSCPDTTDRNRLHFSIMPRSTRKSDSGYSRLRMDFHWRDSKTPKRFGTKRPSQGKIAVLRRGDKV